MTSLATLVVLAATSAQAAPERPAMPPAARAARPLHLERHAVAGVRPPLTSAEPISRGLGPLEPHVLAAQDRLEPDAAPESGAPPIRFGGDREPRKLHLRRGAPQASANAHRGQIELASEPMVTALAEDLLMDPGAMDSGEACPAPLADAGPYARKVAAWCQAFAAQGPDTYSQRIVISIGAQATTASVLVRADEAIAARVNGQPSALAPDAFTIYGHALELAEAYGRDAYIERDPQTGAISLMTWREAEADAEITVEVELQARDGGLRPR